jgi:cell division protein FtsL
MKIAILTLFIVAIALFSTLLIRTEVKIQKLNYCIAEQQKLNVRLDLTAKKIRQLTKNADAMELE